MIKGTRQLQPRHASFFQSKCKDENATKSLCGPHLLATIIMYDKRNCASFCQSRRHGRTSGVRLQAQPLGSSSPDQAIHHLGPSTVPQVESCCQRRCPRIHVRNTPCKRICSWTPPVSTVDLSLKHPILSRPFLGIFKRWLVW